MEVLGFDFVFVRPVEGASSIAVCRAAGHTCAMTVHDTGWSDTAGRAVYKYWALPQLQSIDGVFDVLVAQVQQIRAKSWETVEIPQLQLVFSWTSCCSAVLSNNKCPWSMVQFIDGCERPCDYEFQWKCSRFRSSRTWWTFQLATETGARVSTVAAMMVFDAFCVIFRAPPVVPELSASFSSFRALTTVSARGLQGCRSRREFTPR